MIIKTKLDLKTTYYALCKFGEKITCPVCNGQYERKIKQDNFEGVVKCKNCDYGKVNKYFYKIIPFKITYCYWDEDGDPIESHLEVNDDYMECLKNHKSNISLDHDYINPIYRTYYGYGDYDTDYYVTINETELQKIFNTREEAETKLKELSKEENKKHV